MGKMFAAVIAGVFIGAFAAEVFKRTRPGLAAGAENSAMSKIDEFKQAFAEGYAGSTVEER
ncbi:MAG: hypothetical protein DRJ42_23350 [Deltaproteobacteria bacterium]|nr:MAG: hypothetical protein DRJ42_23350 [Deltaproteobacteria bacterium]